MLDGVQRDLVESNTDLIDIAVSTTLRKYNRKVTEDEREDLHAEAAKHLVECASRWPAYAEEKGADPGDVNHFRVFATRRMKGSIIDLWRRSSPLTRSEINLSTFAMKHGIPAAMEKYQASRDKVQDALDRREALLVPEALPDAGTETAHRSLTMHEPGRDLGLEPVHRVVQTFPPMAKAWVSLVFVHHLPVAEARALLGLRDSDDAATLQGFVEYHLIEAVLSEDVRRAALDALFDGAQVTVLGDGFLVSQFPVGLVQYAQQAGMTVTEFIESSVKVFVADDAYFDEVIQSAQRSRSLRNRVASYNATQARRRENSTPEALDHTGDESESEEALLAV